MSTAFSLSEFTELVSTALEIDTSLDSKLSTFSSFTHTSSYSTANAKPFPSLPLTPKSSTNSPRVLRKIKSLLAYGNSKFNLPAPPPLPSSSSKFSRSEPLMANSEPSSPLNPIPSVSLLDQRAQSKSDAALFVPYLPLADRHERFGTGASIFSRHGSDCGSSVFPPKGGSDSGHSTFSKPLPTPPRSPIHRRASYSSSVSYSQTSESSESYGDLISVSRWTATRWKESSISSSYTSSSSFQKSTEPSSKSSMQSHSLDTSDLDPFAKGRVQVVTCRTSTGSSYGGSSVCIHPFSSNHPAQSILTVQEEASRENLVAEYNHPLSGSASLSKSSQRRKRVSSIVRPKQKPAPTCPLPLPPKSTSPTGPLPPTPVDTTYASLTDGSNGLPSPPITPPGSFRESSVLSNSQNEKDWTLGMPYTSDEDISDLRRIVHGAGLSRSKEVVPRRRSCRPPRNEDSPVLPRTERFPNLLSPSQRRTALKPMGHKRKGSPFPLILAPSASGSIPSPNEQACTFSPTTSAPSSVLSSGSDSSTGNPLEAVHRRREMMMREPARMILGKKGFPVPLSITTTTTIVESNLGVDEDTETPMQSPTTPTSGQLAHAQGSVIRECGLFPSLQPKRERPRQPVPESVVMISLDPFAASDSESLNSGEETTYWTARSSIDSVDTEESWTW